MSEATATQGELRQPFAIRGALEGFYGAFYTAAQRDDLIRFLGEQGFNKYLYGPKNDRYHRREWRTPYPAWQMAQFATTVETAQQSGVSFGYALSPGATIGYHSADDFAQVTAKLHAFYQLGVRDFSLFLDDIDPQFADSADAIHYANYAVAQADLCNRTLAWLKALDPGCTLSMCPTDYHGAPPFSDYLQQLGAALDGEIGVFYTGPQICSTAITKADAEAFGQAVQRPPLLWDNYPVNDLAMQPELHIGPIRGRSADLPQSVAGLYANLMLQPEAAKIPLHTFAAYFRDPEGYEAEAAWEAALRCVAGEASAQALRRLGENSLGGCLRTPEAERLTALAEQASAALAQGQGTQSAPFQALALYLQELDTACYHLMTALQNGALRQDILPWLEGLQLQQDMGQHALMALRAVEAPAQRPLARLPEVRRLKELVLEVEKHHKRIGGESLRPLAREALRRVALADAQRDPA